MEKYLDAEKQTCSALYFFLIDDDKECFDTDNIPLDHEIITDSQGLKKMQ